MKFALALLLAGFSTAASASYYTCKGEGKFAGVTLSGYSDMSTSAGLYACIGDKIADYVSGDKADHAITAEFAQKGANYLFESLPTKYYQTGTKEIPVLRVRNYKRNILVKSMDWATYKDEKKSDAVTPVVGTFTCQDMETIYSSACYIKKADLSDVRMRVTKDFVEGKFQAMNGAQLGAMVSLYVQRLVQEVDAGYVPAEVDAEFRQEYLRYQQDELDKMIGLGLSASQK